MQFAETSVEALPPLADSAAALFPCEVRKLGRTCRGDPDAIEAVFKKLNAADEAIAARAISAAEPQTIR